MINTKDVDRVEVIDHRQCVWCRGRMVANYLQQNGDYKEQPCDKCDGSGIMGGRVYVASSNAERSMIEVELSFQDDGRTLKVFVKDREPRFERITFKEAVKVSPNILTGFALWIGLICSPSMSMQGKCNNRRHR